MADWEDTSALSVSSNGGITKKLMIKSTNAITNCKTARNIGIFFKTGVSLISGETTNAESSIIIALGMALFRIIPSTRINPNAANPH